jgi:serine/threonine protein kinase
LKLESQIIKRLKSQFIPQFVAVGRFVAPHIDEGVYTYMVMERLGLSVSELRKSQPNQRFSIQTCALLGIQMVEGIRDLHGIGVVHRDIKPANFCIRETWPNCVLIDFGLSRKYINSDGSIRSVLWML